MFTRILAALLVAHASIHLLGTAKAFGWSAVPQLAQPVSRPAGVLWLLAALLWGTTVVMLFAVPRAWWMAGTVALIASQAAIFTAWGDAKFGTVANVLFAGAILIGFLHDGPPSFNATYFREVAGVLSTPARPGVLTEADLAPLPEIVRRYVRQSGAVGQPRVANFRVRFRGRIRSGATARWMPFTGEQVNGVHPASRHFLMDATMLGVPLQAFHRYAGGEAMMRVRIASVVPIVDARGAAMTAAETVTLLNDLCVFAPGALADTAIRWQDIDARHARATFTNGGHTVGAELEFNDAAELVNFWSDDRGVVGGGGASVTRMRWSTPLESYRTFGAHRVASRGAGVWHAPEGPYVYIELELTSMEFDVATTSPD